MNENSPAWKFIQQIGDLSPREKVVCAEVYNILVQSIETILCEMVKSGDEPLRAIHICETAAAAIVHNGMVATDEQKEIFRNALEGLRSK